MGLLDDIVNRQNQKRANSFVEKIKTKSDSEIEQEFLNTKEFQNNEIVLSHIFFNNPSLIRILPLEFQVNRINSNLSMFKYGSPEAQKELVSKWIHENKLFMNAGVINLSDQELDEYIKIYFKQKEDVANLYMSDLSRVVRVLSENDLKQTEDIIKSIKDKLIDKQWEFVIEVNPSFIKYASEAVQKEHSTDEKYISYLSGSARNNYIDVQVDKINEDLSLLDEMDPDVQARYIKDNTYLINYLSIETLINVLKYDSNLIRYVNFNINKNKEDKTQDVLCGILENIETKSNKELINILINKCLLNAKAKLYRFNPNSNEISYQYTKRIMRILQGLTLKQIITLIMIDANYALPYIVPVYNRNVSLEEKKKIITDANSRCLNLFKEYYGEDLYNLYYKEINKIYNEYSLHMNEYDFAIDYRCIFDLFKVLFNKTIINNNRFENVSLFIGTSIFYKNTITKESKATCIKLLNDLLANAYNTQINNDKEIYNIGSLELFDPKLSFINTTLLHEFSSSNFVNTSNLLLIIKTEKIYNLFKKYYEIMTYIHGESKETLYRIIENFSYNKSILEDIEGKELDDEEIDSLSLLLSTYNNRCKITKKEQLSNYNILLFKQLIKDLSKTKDQNIYKNILCNYLFNRGYDEKGNTGWLEISTVKEICDVFEVNTLYDFVDKNNNVVFDDNDVKLFTMIKLLFSTDDFDLLLSFVNNIVKMNIKRNPLSLLNLFNKIKKHKIELINEQAVTLEEIESYYESTSGSIVKNSKDGVIVYTITGLKFRVLCSETDDSEDLECLNISELDKNVYVFNHLPDGPVRFASENGKTIIKLSEDVLKQKEMKAQYILLVNEASDDIIEIAKSKGLCIIEVRND